MDLSALRLTAALNLELTVAAIIGAKPHEGMKITHE
jgi:hypothetical protein